MRYRECICLHCGHLYQQTRVGRAGWTHRQCPRCGDGNVYERVVRQNGSYRPGKLAGDGTRTDTMLKDVNTLRAPKGQPPCQA